MNTTNWLICSILLQIIHSMANSGSSQAEINHSVAKIFISYFSHDKTQKCFLNKKVTEF